MRSYQRNVILYVISLSLWFRDDGFICILAFSYLLFVILMFFVPESPRWLMVHKKEYEKAREILKISDPEGVDAAIHSIHQSIDEERQKASLSVFFQKRFTTPILLAVL